MSLEKWRIWKCEMLMAADIEQCGYEIPAAMPSGGLTKHCTPTIASLTFSPLFTSHNSYYSYSLRNRIQLQDAANKNYE